MQRSEMAVSILFGRHFDSVGTGNVKPVDFQKKYVGACRSMSAFA